MNCGLYLITNKITGDYYCGSSVRLKQRWAQHKRSVINSKFECPRLHESMYSYGIENFEFKILLFCDAESLSLYEQRWLDLHVGKPECYNIAVDATIAIRNLKKSEKHKQNISTALMGHVCSEETKKKIGLANIGKIRSKETKQKLSLVGKGHPRYENQVTATINFNKTRIWSTETRLKLSLARKRQLQKELD